MFGPKLGGLEQVFVDYSEALSNRGHEVLHIVAPGAMVIPQLRALDLPYREVRTLNQYDPLAMWRLRRALRSMAPDVVIAQGNRAINLSRRASAGVAPLIAVNHSIKVRRTIGVDFAIAINEDMRERLIAAGQPESRTFKAFNMIRRPPDIPAPAPFSSTPVIGAMGRFVAKKGFEVFIEALRLLRAEGVAFRAVLAGDGDLASALKAQARTAGLDDVLSFPGWVADKTGFFRAIDVFSFTSNHDVCPVVLLEAFLFAKPVVLTDCPGPREISEDGVDSLRFPINDAQALAARIKSLIEAPELALRLAAAAQKKILDNHVMEKAGERLEAIVATAVAERSQR
jgi:glycosyltransferase involved in cell wall biosynthesis